MKEHADLARAIAQALLDFAAAVEAQRLDAAPKGDAPKAPKAQKAEAPKAEAPKAEAPKAEAPKAEGPTYEDVKAALLELGALKGREAVVAVLKEHGATKAPDLKPEQYAAVISAAKGGA